MPIPAPLDLYNSSVQPEWLDLNDHMNVAYFLLAFDQATDELYRFVGVAEDYIEARGHSMFTLVANTIYRRELRRGDAIRITTQILGFDAKKIHYIHHMYHGDEGYLAAATEWLVIHVDMNARRSAPFPDDIVARLREIGDAHAALPVPPEVGRVISLNAGKPG